MRRYLLLTTFSFMIPLCLFSQGKGGHSLKFKINGIKDTIVQIGNHYGDKQYLKDSARVDANGRFTFEGKEKLDKGIYLLIMPDKKYFEFIMDDEQHFSLETDSEDFVKNMKVKGSVENTLFYEYLNYITPRGKQVEELRNKLAELSEDEKASSEIKEQMSEIDKEVVNYKKDFVKKQPETFVAKMFLAMTEIEIPEAPLLENGAKDSLFSFRYYKQHFWDHIDFTDDRILRSPIYHNKLKRYIEQLTLQIPDSINVAADHVLSMAKLSPELFKYSLWFITNTYERSNVMGMDAVFVYLVEQYYMTNQAFWVDSTTLAKINSRALQLKPLLLGKKTPELFMPDAISGKATSLHNTKAQYTILYFWDPDCGHCKKVTPKVYETYLKFKDKGVAAYAVCTDVDIEKLKTAIKEKELNWLNVYDPYNQTNFRKIYDIYSTPVIYLLDEKKEIIAKRLGHEQLEEILQKKLEENIK
jgi:peroxiredoxin